MLNFMIDFDEPFDAPRFISAIQETECLTEYSVKDGVIVSVSVKCKKFFDALLIVQKVQTILTNLKIEVRPFSFSFSELLD